MVMAALREFVRNVLVIIVLATFLQLILPQGSLRRYAHLALALVLVLTLLEPLLTLTRTSWDVAELLGQAQTQTAWTQLQASSELLRQQNEATLLHTYRHLLESQINDILDSIGGVELVECHIELVEDQQAADFGRILSMRIVCRETSSDIKPVSPVTRVQIGAGTNANFEETPKEVETPLGQEVRQAIARYFHLSEVQVTVVIT